MQSHKPQIHDVRILEPRGPWKTKSGGNLQVLFALPFHEIEDTFLKYKNTPIPDIRGLRLYTIRDLPKESIGGIEWHKIREEMIFTHAGSVKWQCEDTTGAKREFVVSSGMGIWIPPFILHTYTVLEHKTELLVLSNTIFDSENPAAQDTYSKEEFNLETITP